MVNFITKKDFTGVSLAGFTDFTEAGNATIYRVSGTAGYGKLDEQGFNVMGSVSYATSGILFGADRDFVNGNQPNRGLSIDTRVQGALEDELSKGMLESNAKGAAGIILDVDTGEVLALRTGYWRAYDFMWGLHIMDPVGREDTSHALLWIFSVIALISSLLGSTLLFRRRKAAR